MQFRSIVLSSVLISALAFADDGASSIGAGGLIVMKREQRVAMAKEVLEISEDRVKVAYEFRNDTDSDVVTEVTFPVPNFTDPGQQADIKQWSFESFKLWVEDKPVQFATEQRAMCKGRDVTDELKAAGVHWATFGNSQEEHSDYSRLSPAAQKRLTAEGLYHSGEATWEIQRRYHWQQRFPAHGTVRIRHEYQPVTGSQIVDTAALKTPLPAGHEREEAKLTHEIFDSLCVSKAAQLKLTRPTREMGPRWVDFILTTANTWKQPIGDCTLLVDRKAPESTVSFCWDGPVEKVSPNQFRAHVQNLVPAKELHVGWYEANSARQ